MSALCVIGGGVLAYLAFCAVVVGVCWYLLRRHLI